MASLIPGFEYDIFISYRQKDNKHNGWITSFVENLKGELESTFKEEISVYFDINPHDGLLETHDVDASLKEKLKCLVFIPIVSRTYCDPKSFAWEHEFKEFIEQASHDQFGLKVKLSDGNVTLRVLPVQIHELDANDKNLVESELGGKLRGIEFIYREPGVNRPLVAYEDHPDHNLNKTFYRNQINKVANAIKEILNGLENHGIEKNSAKRISEFRTPVRKKLNFKITTSAILFLALVVSGYFVIPGLIKHKDQIEKSIAVLPFVNDSPEKENEYVCSGMMDEILNDLQKILDLRVKAKTSTERFRNLDVDIKDIGRALQVSYLLEGSVSKSGDNLRVETELIDAKTGDRIWSEKYNGKYTSDIFVFQSKIAKEVAASLQAVISPSERRRIDEKPTTGIIANDLLMRAEEMVRKWRYTGDSISLNLAFNLLNQTLKVDPGYNDALVEKTMLFSETKRYDSALVYIGKLKAIDPENIDYYDQKGLYYFYNNVPDSALKYFLKEDEIRPNNVWTKLVIGQIYIFQKHEPVKGLTYFQKSIDLGGISEPEINQSISTVYSYLDYYPKAEKYLKNALSITSACELSQLYNYIILNEGNYNKAVNFLDSICNVTACQQNCDLMRFYLYTTQKDFGKAEKYYKKALSEGYKNDDKVDLYIKRADETDLYIGYLYSETGRKKEAASILHNFIQREKNNLAPNLNTFGYSILNLHLAAAYSMLGDNKNALFYLTEVEKTDPFEWPFKVRTFPGFDRLRNNPEFISVLKHIEDKKADIRAQIRKMEERKEINM